MKIGIKRQQGFITTIMVVNKEDIINSQPLGTGWLSGTNLLTFNDNEEIFLDEEYDFEYSTEIYES